MKPRAYIIKVKIIPLDAEAVEEYVYRSNLQEAVPSLCQARAACIAPLFRMHAEYL